MKMAKQFKIRENNKVITLTDKHYKAAGGQGTIFCLQDKAYKIYHDPAKTIPEAKIIELSNLKEPSILAPIEPIYDYVSNKPLGFSMPYIEGVEFLCQIFTKTFRDNKGISPTDIVTLVTQMQKTLQYIHSRNVIVVDYNEMNFLLDKTIKTVYHIDVDSWQTRNFPAVAIMDSVRDRKGPKGAFTELTDWFSWAIVTFQMYMGIHPYKGRHPDFKPSEWLKRMDQGVSVFDQKATLPPTCQDFSVIPKRHLEWYKAVFQKNERSIPPPADGITMGAVVAKTIISKGNFIIKELIDLPEAIRNVFNFNGKQCFLTRKGIYNRNKDLIFIFKKLTKSAVCAMCNVFGEDPLVVYFQNKMVEFLDLAGNVISSIEAEDIMGYNGAIYSISNGQLVENTFERLGKIIHRVKVVCDLSNSYKVFRGVVFQDDFMKCRVVIPFSLGMCINMPVKELNGHRIVDARYNMGICMIMSENQGKYYKSTLCFNSNHSEYQILNEEVIDYHMVNFIVLPNKLCLAVGDEKLSLFKDLTGTKEISDPPFDVSMRLYNDNMQVLFVDDKKLYSITMK